MPASEEARQSDVEEIKLGEIMRYKGKGGSQLSRSLTGAKPSLKRPGARLPQEIAHSVNNKNRNRIRRSLLRQRHWVVHQPGPMDEERRQRLEEIEQQLTQYPPRPRPIKSSPFLTTVKEAKSAGPKICSSRDQDRVDKPCPCSVTHFCKPRSRIRREVW